MSKALESRRPPEGGGAGGRSRYRSEQGGELVRSTDPREGGDAGSGGEFVIANEAKRRRRRRPCDPCLIGQFGCPNKSRLRMLGMRMCIAAIFRHVWIEWVAEGAARRRGRPRRALCSAAVGRTRLRLPAAEALPRARSEPARRCPRAVGGGGRPISPAGASGDRSGTGRCGCAAPSPRPRGDRPRRSRRRRRRPRARGRRASRRS